MRKIVLFLVCSLLYLALSIYAVEPDPNLIVSTKQGKVLGYYPNTSTRAFTGIRFAASTAGSNRFKPPVNVPDVVSPDTFNATSYGSVCVQSDTSGNKYDQDQSEDCLFLNIWTPANANATNKYPVFFWIHGGAFKYGTGNMYQGDYWTQISQQVGSPIVVVTFNYRLGILGFLSDSLMKTENGLTPGNLGLLDQLSALTWVRKNIDNFGGDSSKITIGGESAGGVSTLILLTSPLLGKVKSAIAQSGSFLPWLIQQTVSESYNISTKFKNAVNCTQLSCLRALPTSTILSYQDNSLDLFVPVIDSYVTNDTIYNNFLIGNYKQVPTIIGTTYNETTQWTCGGYPTDIGTAAQRSVMVGVFGKEKVNSFWSSIPTYYPNVGYDNNLEYFNVYFGDAEMHCNARHAASLFTKYVSKVYLFTFNYFIDYPLFDESCYGASHAVELPFFFPSVMKVRLTSKFYTLTPDEANFSKQLIRYWSNFIVSSNVNNNVSGSNLSADMVTWPSYTVCNNKRIMLKKNALSITSSLYSTVCPFWNGITDFPVQTC